MDLKLFYQKIRKLQEEIPTPHVVVVSHDTPDGGKAGRKTEVTRAIAARMVVEGRARLATPEETAEYQSELEQAHRQVEQETVASREQLNSLRDSVLKALKTPPKTAGKN